MTRAFALQDRKTGHLVINSIRYTAKQVREYAIETDREYELNDEELTDAEIWRRNIREGWRVVRVEVSTVASKNHSGESK